MKTVFRALWWVVVMVGLVSAGEYRHPLFNPNVIRLLSELMDWSDLFRFSQVCRLFNKWAHITVAVRVGLDEPIENSHRVRMIIEESEMSMLHMSHFYHDWDGLRTLIQLRDKHLLVRGVGTHVSPGYTGRCLVKRRAKFGSDSWRYPQLMDLSSKTDPEWIWQMDSNCAMSLHSGQKITLPHEIIAIRFPFFVAYSGRDYELYRINGEHQKQPDFLAKVAFHLEEPEQSQLFRNPNSKNGWPIMIQIEAEFLYTFQLIDFEKGTLTTHPIPGLSHSDSVEMDWLYSPEPLVWCVISEQHCWRIINLQTGKTISESVIPLPSYIENRPRKMHSELSHPHYNCQCNGRYGLISFSYNVRYAVGVDDRFVLFDLKTGELIGSAMCSHLEWISEELFRVDCNHSEQLRVRSVHQPRQDIECVLVDEHGNEERMMDQHYWTLGNDVLIDRRTDEILKVEFQKSSNDNGNSDNRDRSPIQRPC